MATGYYVDDLDVLPVDLVASAMGDEIPRWLAILVARWFRFRARVGMRPMATCAARLEPEITWRYDSAPAGARGRWAPWLEQLDDEGFEQIGWIESSTIGDKSEANFWLCNPPGTIFVQLNWTMMGGIEDGTVSLQSYLPGDRELQTISIRARWQHELLEHLSPEYLEVIPIKTNSLSKLLAAHEQRLAKDAPIAVSRPEFTIQLQRQTERFFHHCIQLGFLREISMKEYERLQ